VGGLYGLTDGFLGGYIGGGNLSVETGGKKTMRRHDVQRGTQRVEWWGPDLRLCVIGGRMSLVRGIGGRGRAGGYLGFSFDKDCVLCEKRGEGC